MNFQCTFCKNEFDSLESQVAHRSKCLKRLDFLDSISAEDLKKLYYEQEMSCQDIANYYSLKLSEVFSLMQKRNIDRRSLSEANKKSKKKRSDTTLKKTGFKHNFCRDSPSRIKMKKNLLKKYGVENVFQLESVKKKSLNTLIKKYGKENIAKVKTCRGRRVYSSIHRKVVEILEDLKISASIEFKLKVNSKKYYSYDIIINNTNKIIEVNGDYWHGNPLIYKKDDIIMKGSSKEFLVRDKWAYDKKKNKFAEKSGYKVLVLWENDIKNNLESVIDIIKNYCNN